MTFNKIKNCKSEPDYTISIKNIDKYHIKNIGKNTIKIVAFKIKPWKY